eukprot:11179912-Lingulodinium_polyedra.AAC.1
MRAVTETVTAEATVSAQLAVTSANRPESSPRNTKSPTTLAGGPNVETLPAKDAAAPTSSGRRFAARANAPSE